ncbi:hypothetical protein E4T50_13269 [Aureobasidium sp. EXF-12298]|nr:hypothetical protein E4T50_13269 [Aureobasidium sp. EXF-12298]
MLSLPLLAPQNEYSFFLSPHLRPPSSDPHTTDTNAAQQSRRLTQQTSAPTRQSLAQLLADEQAISHRKHNIRRFGAGWIKPPGVAKTLQAETEEKAEREEQEALQRREQMMMDMQAQQEAEEARNRAVEAEAEAEQEAEVDLDEEIPDAEEDEDEDEDITDSDEEEEEEEQSELHSELQSHLQHSEVPVAEDITFNEESMFADTSIAALDEESREQERYRHLQEAELTGVAQDEFDLGIERDLDDSVPEAGSYQHTDSELEDSDEESDDEEEEEEPSQLEQQEEDQSEIVGAVMQRSRSSLLSRDVSSLLDSSFVTSSPAPIGRLRSAGHRANQR